MFLNNLFRIRCLMLLFLCFNTATAYSESQNLSAPALSLQTNGLKVSLNWTADSNATGYSLYYAAIPYKESDAIGKVNLGSTTELNATLWLGTAYYVAIQSYNDFFESDISNIESINIPEKLNSSLSWKSISFTNKVNIDVQNITDILFTNDGRVLASFYDATRVNYIALSSDQGENWQVYTFPSGVENIRALRQLSDGSFLMGCSSRNSEAILFKSEDGLQWSKVETTNTTLPNQYSTSVWDILQLNNGDILLATDNTDNNPELLNPTLYRLSGDKLDILTSMPGLGVLALEKDNEDNIYLSTEESDAHDDPTLAGQARIFKSSDAGDNWEEIATPEGANRIYDMFVASDNSFYLGTGINGNFYRSIDKGSSWQLMTHVPTTDRLFGNPPVMTPRNATRVYQILELDNGVILVGTGNITGSIFITEDKGESWISTSSTGTNIVTWGLAQSPQTGLIWAGTGSYGGDIFTASYQPK